MANKQLENVGNLGDVVKHGSLVRLAKLMSTKAIKAPLLYFDTHAFLLSAPWNNELRWKQTVNRKLADHPYYKDYVRLEADRLDKDEGYRCSPGLVVDVINQVPHRIYLAEKDDETRDKLQSQIRDEMIRVNAVVDDAEAFADIEPPGGDDYDYEKDDVAIFALVDPFELDHAEWARISEILGDFVTEDSYGVIEVFDFDPDRDAADWPAAPEHFHGPVATLDEGPYHLATYATRKMVPGVVEELERLGWTIHVEEVEKPEEE